MAQNHQTPCSDCARPAYGPRCRSCASLVNPRNSKPSASQQPRVTVTRTLALACAPTYPWWADCDRAQFSQRFAEEWPRMVRGASIN